MNDVLALLERGRKAPPTVSALDAVMGEDWAIVELGRARKARPIRTGMRQKHRQDVSRKSARSGGTSAYLPGRRPQAVVKMVRGGGASDVRGLKAQMDYLSRDGEQPLVRSERYMGIEIDEAERETIESGWEMPPEGSNLADRTSHFIASFPSNSDHDAAERSGRAWAEEMFGSGNYGGDSFDYYTAFHTDRDHPHMHVIVNRRGMDNGAWLKVSQRSDLNYDVMRETLVRVAGREGIELEATSRYERAIHDRPIPDAEYRRAKDEGRDAVAPEHTQQTAILAAAALIHHARQFSSDAQLIEREAPELAAVLYQTSESIAQGRALTAQSYNRSINGQEIRAMSERLEEKRSEVRENFKELDGNVAQLDAGADRVRVERQVAELKAQSAAAMGRERNGLREYQERDTSGRYEGMAGAEVGPQGREAQERAESQVRHVAERYGVNADAAVERVSGGIPSVGLAREYAAGEAREREQSRADRGEREETSAQRDAELTKMHNEIGSIYREAREQAAVRDRGQAENATSADRQREVAAEVRQGVGDQFDRPSNEYTQFEPIVVSLDRAGARNPQQVAEATLDLDAKRRAGQFNARDTERADAMIGEAARYLDRPLGRSVEMNEADWRRLDMIVRENRSSSAENVRDDGRSISSSFDANTLGQAEQDRAAERNDAAHRAQDQARQDAAPRTRQDRAETETDRWIREREAQEARDRDGGRGV